MKIHTTDYTNTFITVADDCKAKKGEAPPLYGGKKTIAGMQYELLGNSPYIHTSDEVLFRIHAERNNIPENELDKEKELFFSKGRACFRSSPLAKQYGWGIHFNSEGKMALAGVETKRYRSFSDNSDLVILPAMRSKRRQ